MTHPRGYALAFPLVLLLLAVLPAAARAATAPVSGDPFSNREYALRNDGPNDWFAHAAPDADVDATEAWAGDPAQSAPGVTGAGVTVAVVDTAIDTSQPDLQANIATGGTDVTQPDACTSGMPEHGTLVAGIVAAIKDNGYDVAGVAPDAKVLPVKALDNCGDASPDWVIDGLKYAADSGAPIVVASFASDPLHEPAADVEARFDAVFADHPETLFVVAAGNEGNNNDDRPVYPCNSPAANVLCVGSSDSADAPACTSNVGQDSVDLFAPGQGIYSTAPGKDFPVQFSGTSAAAPMVAGVAALVLEQAQNQGITFDGAALAAQLAGRANVDPKFAMDAISASGGRLNALRALGETGDLGLGGADPQTDWASCDGDHDGLRDTFDACPAAAGPTGAPNHGCPDSDGDGVLDRDDNCKTVPNSGQADADHDHIGDACDSTPRGPDDDGDGRALLDDRCPAQWAQTADGCPVTPTVTPAPTTTPAPVTPIVQPPAPARVVSLSVRASRRTARVAVRLSRSSTVTLRVERRVRSHGQWRWRRVVSRALTGTARTLSVSRLAQGSYRVSAVLSGATVRRSFRV